MTKKRILLVDDEPSFTRILKLYLEKTGAYEVREENYGRMALVTARQFEPDLILLDVAMPDMDGGEVAFKIRADEKLKNTPIVFLTATVAKDEQGIIAGHPFMAKPVTAQQVIECIQGYLGTIQELPTSSNVKAPRHFVIPMLAILLVGSGFLGYKLYTQSRQSQRETFKELQDTRTKLSALRSSATEAILDQQKTIDLQGNKLAEKNTRLRRMKAMEALLKKTLKNIEETKVSNLSNSSAIISSLSEFTASVVRVDCLANAYSDDIQQGSGFLYRASRNTPEFPLYYIQTTLNVAKTTDRSISRCRIVLYPDYTDRNSYLLFESKGYRSYGEDIDIAILEPEIVRNNVHAGTRNDLIVYARNDAEILLCGSVKIGDHLSILGYPIIGGETFSVTTALVSGFELEQRSRYVKTSAKPDPGNSGGVAIKDSGCLVGIPTSSRRGRLESIGRILDLRYIRNEKLIK